MTFRDIIEGMHRRESSIRGGALAGSDGLAVEEWSAAAGLDLSALCAEMVQFFKESVRVAGEHGLGGASEVSVITSYSIHYTKLYDLRNPLPQGDRGEEQRDARFPRFLCGQWVAA